MYSNKQRVTAFRKDTWTASSEFGTYRLCEQRRFRRACASAQSRQNLRCSLIQAVSQEEPSDRKPDPWPRWMAGHAQLKFVMTECSKTQIRLTGLTCKLPIIIKMINYFFPKQRGIPKRCTGTLKWISSEFSLWSLHDLGTCISLTGTPTTSWGIIEAYKGSNLAFFRDLVFLRDFALWGIDMENHELFALTQWKRSGG